MADDLPSIHQIRVLASEYGLVLRGGFRTNDSDIIPVHESGRIHSGVLLFGQTGSTLWDYFARSEEYLDGKADPMDRWSARVGRRLAEKSGGTALLPFDGPPWYPFLRWAQRAENIRSSPLGILMHPQHGLWHAYRFAIALPVLVEGFEELEHSSARHVARQHATERHACDSCVARDCLKACPVNAFTEGKYDVVSCASYLRQNEQSDCHRSGCLARAACPEGQDSVYELAHRQFHMLQFYASLKKPIELS
ncbi:4Fe-4S dicluster domain-containing protein [Granulosicoccus antarcticus]|uniref:4Fe-4S ferredoxin-type domain-containing protein n=1 Tax=Granulosicoccus antarcticus IMCC3135 TaxID=1192854 RepID=A0A2Z2NK39_9GAMM|nr:4Fe-4S dicluster domain-containing protein [Granulosicoccus antarcticus]ASJ70865.1 hypothetical protein IMCC3135_03760 [Granulosicoccus antarcticus IMCC3135]